MGRVEHEFHSQSRAASKATVLTASGILATAVGPSGTSHSRAAALAALARETTLVGRDQGLIVSPGNPKRLRTLADLVLPAAGWGEKEGTVTNSERRISRVRAAVPAPGEARAAGRPKPRPPLARKNAPARCFGS